MREFAGKPIYKVPMFFYKAVLLARKEKKFPEEWDYTKAGYLLGCYLQDILAKNCAETFEGIEYDETQEYLIECLGHYFPSCVGLVENLNSLVDGFNKAIEDQRVFDCSCPKWGNPESRSDKILIDIDTQYVKSHRRKP